MYISSNYEWNDGNCYNISVKLFIFYWHGMVKKVKISIKHSEIDEIYYSYHFFSVDAGLKKGGIFIEEEWNIQRLCTALPESGSFGTGIIWQAWSTAWAAG